MAIESLTDSEVFALAKERWPGARAVIRTTEKTMDFRVTAIEPGKLFGTENVVPEIDVSLGYSPGAQTIVVFQKKKGSA